MSNIRYVGTIPDHVTRYNHKQNRWMTPPKPYRKTTLAEVVEAATLIFSIGALIVVGVMLLQMA